MPLSEKPVISFLIPSRNRAKIVHDCVLNLLNSGRSDIEIIVRDNCSTDDTVERLSQINDTRLKIYQSPENQGTRNFFEIAKLASGQIVTWISDEDNFEFKHLDYIISRFEVPSCMVMFGSIIVGKSRRRVIFADEIINDPVRANLTTLLFSGCGGVFVRHSCLNYVLSLKIVSEDDTYTFWNYYPVGFFASYCLKDSLFTTSKIVVRQVRYAATNNNWCTKPNFEKRLPHYYPETIFDRLSSSIVNILLKDISVTSKILVIIELIKGFYQQTKAYKNPDFISLLQENYDAATVQAYVVHLNTLKLDSILYRTLYFLAKAAKLVTSVCSTLKYWHRLKGY